MIGLGGLIGGFVDSFVSVDTSVPEHPEEANFLGGERKESIVRMMRIRWTTGQINEEVVLEGGGT